MRDSIEPVELYEIKACNFKPEPHTVQFNFDEKNEWFAYKVDGDIVAVLSIARKHGGMYIGSLFTDFPYRRNGIAEKLIRFATDILYPCDKFICHALISSKRIFEKCGFVHYKTVYFKHGTQYFMKLER